jgi:hypothetical protein
MKTYVNAHSIRLVGKAWEVRHQLRRLLLHCPYASYPLKEALLTKVLYGPTDAKQIERKRILLEKTRHLQPVPCPSS